MERAETPRLVIRRLREADLAAFLAYQTHPETLRYLPQGPNTEERAARFLARQATAQIGDDGGYFSRAVELAATGQMIGEIGLGFSLRQDGQPDTQRQAELGWGLHPDFWGKGYATEAAQVLLQWAFDELVLHRVTAGCGAHNVASQRLMERLGMRREAHFLQNCFVHNVWQDSYIYALLRHEWEASHQLDPIM